jgi:hypothetical protein
MPEKASLHSMSQNRGAAHSPQGPVSDVNDMFRIINHYAEMR